MSLQLTSQFKVQIAKLWEVYESSDMRGTLSSFDRI